MRRVQVNAVLAAVFAALSGLTHLPLFTFSKAQTWALWSYSAAMLMLAVGVYFRWSWVRHLWLILGLYVAFQ